MTRWLLLCVALISLPVLTDWLVDHNFRKHHSDQNIGYSKQDRDGLSRLIESSHGKQGSKAAPVAFVRDDAVAASPLRYQFPFGCVDDGKDCLIVASKSKKPMPPLKLARVSDTDAVQVAANGLAKRWQP